MEQKPEEIKQSSDMLEEVQEPLIIFQNKYSGTWELVRFVTQMLIINNWTAIIVASVLAIKYAFIPKIQILQIFISMLPCLAINRVHDIIANPKKLNERYKNIQIIFIVALLIQLYIQIGILVHTETQTKCDYFFAHYGAPDGQYIAETWYVGKNSSCSQIESIQETSGRTDQEMESYVLQEALKIVYNYCQHNQQECATNKIIDSSMKVENQFIVVTIILLPIFFCFISLLLGIIAFIIALMALYYLRKINSGDSNSSKKEN